MKFNSTRLDGVFILEIEPIEDERGFFARSWCEKEFKKTIGCPINFVQCNISFNKAKGIVRGMHYQVPPHEERKLVRCTLGAIFDVIVDIRPTSSTYLQWMSVELSETNHRMLYIPAGFAHGFQTLEQKSEVFYQMSTFYAPESARGMRWDDPVLSITWPLPNPILSKRDRSYPLLQPNTKC